MIFLEERFVVDLGVILWLPMVTVYIIIINIINI